MASALLSLPQTPVDIRLARSVWFGAGLITIHYDAQDTNGAFGLFETCGGPGTEPPLHIHQNEDETFYVIEGKLKVTRGHEELTLRPGQTGFLPRGVPHTFKILSSYAHALVFVTPGGFEGYFREVGKPAEAVTPPDVIEVPEPERMWRAAEKFGVRFVL